LFNRADKVEEMEACALELLQTNVLGNIHLFNLFLPLVMKGKVKKVIAISSGVGDLDFVNQVDVDVGPLYAASKAQMNLITAKFSAQYKKDRVLFLSISPGLVEVGRYANGIYPLSPGLKHVSILLMYPYSHSGTDEWHDGIRGQACSLCASLQGPNHSDGIRPKNQGNLGERQHRGRLWWCIYLASRKQAMGVNLLRTVRQNQC
jgi:hypothetical protein